MIRCLFPTLVLVFAEIAVCLGQKTTATPKDCNSESGAEVKTVHATVTCGENPFPVFMPKRCRIFKVDFDGKPTKSVKATLNAGESSTWKSVSCKYSDDGDGGLSVFESGKRKDITGTTACAGRSEPGWIDRDGYGFYCDKTLYPPVIPVSCDFGGSVDVVPVGVGRHWGDGVQIAECYYDFNDASITPF